MDSIEDIQDRPYSEPLVILIKKAFAKRHVRKNPTKN